MIQESDGIPLVSLEPGFIRYRPEFSAEMPESMNIDLIQRNIAANSISITGISAAAMRICRGYGIPGLSMRPDADHQQEAEKQGSQPE
jgi:hypothetical protein